MCAGWPLRIIGHALSAFAHGLDALGAQVLAHLLTILKDHDALDVGPKLPLGPHIRVAHIVPKTGRLAAVFAFSHCTYLLEPSPPRGQAQCKGDLPGRQRKSTTTGP